LRAPAKFQQEVSQQTKKLGTSEHDFASRAHMDTALPMGRRMTVATASPKAAGSPSPVAVIHLRIIEGGGRPAEGGVRRAAYRADAGRERARELGLVVHAAAREASI